MRYLCKPAKPYYAPMVTPSSIENEEAARTWADLRAPGRGPWTITAADCMARTTEGETIVITNDDPDYFKHLRKIEENGL